MKLKLFLTLCCLVFVSVSQAEQSIPPKSTTVNQPSPKPINQDGGTKTQTASAPSRNKQKKPNMVAYCNEHTC